MKANLDEEEKELLKSYENGEWEQVTDHENRVEEFAKIASNSLKKDKRINIRISSRDLSEIRRKAVNEGIPYQTLISSILHKYINGSLTEPSA